MNATMRNKALLDEQKHSAIINYVNASTIPLLADATEAPDILGTGTLFQHEDRYFIITAAHILKSDPDNPCSQDIDLTAIAYPTRKIDAKLMTLGPFEVYRPQPPSRVDVVVLELKDRETISALNKAWRFLGFDKVAPFPFNARFLLSGYPVEGVSWDGQKVGQNFLSITTDALDHVPSVQFPEPTVDRFFYLEDEGQLPDGSSRKLPALQGLSGASLWAYNEPTGIWDASKAMKIVGVQSSYLRGQWFRCVDWCAVRHILRTPIVGFQSPP